MLYVPGLDGTGFAAASQFESLARDFDLVALNVPVDDRSSFGQLVDRVVEFLERERDLRDDVPETLETRDRDAAHDSVRERASKIAADPAVYLLGESMGGLISLGVALARPDLVDRLVLVNPASSFDASPWPAIGPLLPNLPEDLYAALPYALAPVLFDPSELAEGALAAARSAATAAASGSADAVPSALASGDDRAGRTASRARPSRRHHPARYPRAPSRRSRGGMFGGERAWRFRIRICANTRRGVVRGRAHPLARRGRSSPKTRALVRRGGFGGGVARRASGGGDGPLGDDSTQRIRAEARG